MNLGNEAPTDDEMREVLAAYGFAAYEAAGVEVCLAQLLSIQQLSLEKPQDKGTARVAFDKHSQQTLGRLIRTVREEVDLPSALTAQFQQALEGRNWLIHHFYREGFAALARRATREDVVQHLNDMALWYSRLSRQLIAELDRHLMLKNVSLERINRETEAFLTALDSSETEPS